MEGDVEVGVDVEIPAGLQLIALNNAEAKAALKPAAAICLINSRREIPIFHPRPVIATYYIRNQPEKE